MNEAKNMKATKEEKGENLKLNEEERGRVSENLKELLENNKKHRTRHYDPLFDTWERMCRGQYKHAETDTSTDRSDEWRNRKYYKLANQKRISAVSQIRDAKPKGSRLPIDVQPAIVKNSETAMEMQRSMDIVGINEEEMLDRHRKALDDNLNFSRSAKEFDAFLDNLTKYGTGAMIAPWLVTDYEYEYELKQGQEPPPQGFENEDGKLTDEGNRSLSNYIKKEIMPERKVKRVVRAGIKNIPIRDFFPDPSCQGDGQKGRGHFVRDYMSIKDIMRQVDKGLYDKESALNIIKESEASNDGQSSNAGARKDDTQYSNAKTNDVFMGIPIYTFYGDILAKDFKIINDKASGDLASTEEQLKDYEVISVIITMGEDGDILRAVENPYPSKMRQIHIAQYERIEGEWAGRGVPEKLQAIQEAMNTLINTWLDSAEIASIPMLGMNVQRMDEDEDLSIYPGKTFHTKGDSSVHDVLQQFNIHDASPNLISSIDRLLQLADSESGVPKIIEGQGDVNAKTAYETQQQEANAIKQFGVVIENIDIALATAGEMINEHMIIYDSENHDFFGDFRVIAKGFEAFEERRVKVMDLEKNIAEWSQSEAVQAVVDGRAMIKEKMRIQNPENLDFVFTEDQIAENEKKAQQAMQQQMAMQQQAEQAKFQAQMQLEQMKGQTAQMMEQMKNQFAMQMKQVEMSGQATLQEDSQLHEKEENEKDRQLERDKEVAKIDKDDKDRELNAIGLALSNKQKEEKPKEPKKDKGGDK